MERGGPQDHKRDIEKLRVFAENASVKFFPGIEKGDALRDYGKKFADYLIAECGDKTNNPGN